MHRIGTAAILLIIVCAGLIQVSAFSYIAILGTKPDLLLIITIFFALSGSKEQSIKSAITAGLVKDITSSSILGSYAISFFLIAIFLNYHKHKFYKEKISTQIILPFVSYAVTGLLVLFFSAIVSRGFSAEYPVFPIIFKGACYTAFLSPFIFFIARHLLGDGSQGDD